MPTVYDKDRIIEVLLDEIFDPESAPDLTDRIVRRMKRRKLKALLLAGPLAAAAAVVILTYVLFFYGENRTGQPYWVVKGKVAIYGESALKAEEHLTLTGRYGACVRIQPESVFEFPGKEVSNSGERGLRLVLGLLRADILPYTSSSGRKIVFTVSTPNALLKVESSETRFSTEMRQDIKLLTVTLYRGAIVVENQYGSYTMQPGDIVHVEDCKAPERDDNSLLKAVMDADVIVVGSLSRVIHTIGKGKKTSYQSRLTTTGILKGSLAEPIVSLRWPRGSINSRSGWKESIWVLRIPANKYEFKYGGYCPFMRLSKNRINEVKMHIGELDR